MRLARNFRVVRYSRVKDDNILRLWSYYLPSTLSEAQKWWLVGATSIYSIPVENNIHILLTG